MKPEEISAVVLAGGRSSRMGQNKAELVLEGKRFIDLQVEKLRALGLNDIMISGYESGMPGTRYVPDVYPQKGPLSGIHACLRQAQNAACLVLGVDVPLLPPDVLRELILFHEKGITMLTHGGKYEPLIAVYDSALHDAAEKILLTEKTRVMKLAGYATLRLFEYAGDERLLANCNTREEYESARRLLARGPAE